MDTCGKDAFAANANDAYAMWTSVKHIFMFVKIVIFTRVNGHPIVLDVSRFIE